MKRIRFHRDNLANHGVEPREVVQCLAPKRMKYLRKVGRKVYQVIAQSTEGRYLEILYKELEDELFVFHAMDARPRDRNLLKRRGKRR